MATLAQGQAARLNLKASQSITVTPSSTGRATVSANGPSNLTYEQKTIYAAETFGPYVADTVMSIAAVAGSLEYTDPYTLVPSCSLDASNNVTGLVGPDGGRIQLTPSPRSIVLFGDSQTENNQDIGSFAFSALTQTNGVATLTGLTTQTGQLINISRVAEEGYFGTHQITVVGGNATFPVPLDTPAVASSRLRGDGVNEYTTLIAQYVNRNASRGWMHLANYRAGGTLFEVVHNSAYGGDTTWGMLERIDHADWGVTPYSARYVSENGGINDLTAEVPAATVIDNKRAIWDYLQARGYTVIPITLTPLVAGHAGHAVTAIDVSIIQVNDWIRQEAARRGLMLWDFFSVVNDPTASTLTGKSGYIHPTDFIHYSPLCAWELASHILDVCQNMLPGVQNTLPSWANDSRAYDSGITQNQLNPLMTGTSGTVSNQATIEGGQALPTNWTVNHSSAASSTAVCRTVARSVGTHGDAIGNMAQVTLTINAAAESGYIRNTPSNNSTLEVGEWYYVEAAVRIEDWIGMDLPSLQYAVTIDSVTTGATSCFTSSSNAWGDQPSNITANLVMRTPNFYVPAGTSASGTAGVVWRSAESSASGVIQLGRCHLRKVSD